MEQYFICWIDYFILLKTDSASIRNWITIIGPSYWNDKKRMGTSSVVKTICNQKGTFNYLHLLDESVKTWARKLFYRASFSSIACSVE